MFTPNGFGISLIAINSAVTPGKSDLFSMISSATVFETFCATGIGWNKEPDQQIGGFFAPFVPQGVNRSLMSDSGIFKF